MATIKINANPSRVYVELITDTGERRTIEANEAGEFTIPAKDYRIYRLVEEKPEVIFQASPDCRAYFLSTNGDSARPCDDATVEQQRHAISILELEKAQYKLRAKILGKKLSWIESQKKGTCAEVCRG